MCIFFLKTSIGSENSHVESTAGKEEVVKQSGSDIRGRRKLGYEVWGISRVVLWIPGLVHTDARLVDVQLPPLPSVIAIFSPTAFLECSKRCLLFSLRH
jgi:hypothetical protein